MEHIDRIDEIAHIAHHDIANAIGRQIPGANCFCQHGQRPERKEPCRDETGDRWKICFHQISPEKPK
jgi:hypothetical protein